MLASRGRVVPKDNSSEDPPGSEAADWSDGELLRSNQHVHSVSAAQYSQ